MLGLYLRLAPDIVVNCRAIDIMHHCIFFMCTMIILVLDVYTIGGLDAYRDDYSGVCQQGMGMCFMVDALQDDYLDIMQHHLFLCQWFALDLTIYALTGWLVTLISCELQMLYM